MSNMQAIMKGCSGTVATLVSVALFITASDALAAAPSAGTIGAMASQITSSFASVTKLITAMSYLAGLGFAVGSIIKFKAHKDNAAQVPIGQPIGLLLVAAALLFLPSILNVVGQTMFGGGQTTAGTTGVTSF